MARDIRTERIEHRSKGGVLYAVEQFPVFSDTGEIVPVPWDKESLERHAKQKARPA